MSAMSSEWAAVVAAAAAGVFGIGGTLAGMLVGRRHVTDQATVEHGQWLRGQRQEAYVLFLDRWDAAVDALQEIAAGWDERERRMGEYGQDDEFQDAIAAAAAVAADVVTAPLERAYLLGPGPVEAAVEAADTALDELSAFLIRKAGSSGSNGGDWSPWLSLLTQAQNARRQFVQAAKHTLQEAPRPGK